ncbi:patatin-like phospholipase family protein [Chitinilyticum piscinae]|uniref:Patatin-like phospholipase family protein n=1 Tax=Chitinilyticum piscinae TaxID=2866724 RepID=A0A8J7FVT4_9NEIS|nr:patatin-like phospholipase family protein [Chitinilyticum piscinae]MBE9608000.1 patatin-like phospholipase family protein [Chitinilyticum piscinae]
MAAGSSKKQRKPLNLALQGGGSHGAFTWGVLDRLLEEDCFDFDSIVGTSAGAMNAAALAYGLKVGGPEQARACLREYWELMMKTGAYAPWPSLLDRMIGDGNMNYSPVFDFADALTRIASPYQLNPKGFNPIQPTIEKVIDFARLRELKDTSPKLFLCATNVMNGRVKVFERDELTVDAVLASACLPFMYHAVEIDGEFYWDGGYMGNPPIFPIFYNSDCRDVMIVQITPINLAELPTTATAIFDRINGLSFNSSLMREMRVVNFINGLVRKGFDDGGKLKEAYIHTIDAEETMNKLGAASQANLDRSYITRLFELGRNKAEAFIQQHYAKVGVVSSVDIEDKFL